jgi:hypothetical protein
MSLRFLPEAWIENYSYVLCDRGRLPVLRVADACSVRVFPERRGVSTQPDGFWKSGSRIRVSRRLAETEHRIQNPVFRREAHNCTMGVGLSILAYFAAGRFAGALPDIEEMAAATARRED